MAALDRLNTAFNATVEDLVELTRTLPVLPSQNDIGGFVILAPSYRWGEASAAQKLLHLSIKRRYEQILELFRAWLYDAPEDLKRDLQEADTRFRTWLELASNWSITPNKSTNEESLRKDANALNKIVEILGAGDRSHTLLIPDTNALLGQPDPTAYRGLCESDAFEFLLLPTVLGELDNLKILHRNPEVRVKAQKVITRIKGWRTQGALLDGVVVDKSIRVRAIHNEPDVADSLRWLDPSNADDRIVASVLRIQAGAPTARVILVTGDINLQNKADAALIEVGELPDS